MNEINWDDDPAPQPATGDTIIVNVKDVRLKASRGMKGAWAIEISVTNEATRADSDEALQELDYLKAQIERRFA